MYFTIAKDVNPNPKKPAMNPSNIIGILSASTLLLPAIFILFGRLYRNKSLLALMISYMVTAIYNLMAANIIPVEKDVRQVVGILNNYVDVPLVMLSFLLFCTSKTKEKLIYISLIAFIIYELVVYFIFGLTTISVVYIMGPGIGIILIYAAYFFSQYVRLSLTRSKAIGKTLMITSVLFGYGCYAMIYFIYYIQKTSAVADVFLIYYIVTIISTLLVTVGLGQIYRRSRQIEEVQLIRKELALFNH